MRLGGRVLLEFARENDIVIQKDLRYGWWVYFDINYPQFIYAGYRSEVAAAKGWLRDKFIEDDGAIFNLCRRAEKAENLLLKKAK